MSLSAVVTVGNRCRFQLTAKPLLSELDLYDASKANWLTSKGALDGEFTPDVDGVYTITAVEETVAANPKHYSTHGSTGGSIGVETITTVGTQAVTVLVGAVLQRVIGVIPDTMIFKAYVHCATHAGFAPTTYGALSYYADQSRCPSLSEPTTDRARIAMQDTTVASELATLGGSINATHYTGTSDAIDYITMIDITPLDSIGWAISVFNDHLDQNPLEIHHVAGDAGNAIVAADAAVGNLASQKALINDLLAKVQAHLSTGGTFHDNADTIFDMSAITALGGGATLADCIAKANQICPYIWGHMMQTILALDAVARVHKGAGDWKNPLTAIVCTNEATMVAMINDAKAKYTLHRAEATLGAYHAIFPGGVTTCFQGDRPRTVAQIPAAITELLGAFQDHCLNIEHTTGTSTGYHTQIDYGGKTDDLPRAAAGDIETALNLFEILIPRMMDHFGKGAPTHAITVDVANSDWYRQNRGVGKITAAFEAALKTSSPSTPSGENTAVAWMTMLGGFKKI